MIIDSDADEAFDRLRSLVEVESMDGELLIANLEDNPVCAVVVDDSIPGIVVEWRRYATSAQFRYIHERIVRLLHEHRLSKVLGDDTAIPMIHADDQAWMTEHWMPRAAAAGWKASANKAPSAFFGHRCVASAPKPPPVSPCDPSRTSPMAGDGCAA